MVKKCFIYLFLCIMGSLGAADLNVNLPAQVSVEISPNLALANRPVPVYVKIIRLEWQKVDEKSFLLGDQPLQVNFVDNQYPSPVQDSQSLVVSRYQFTIPANSAGLYTLESVSALVGGDRAFSTPLSYQIISPISSDDLVMKAGVVETGAIYQGQKITLEYRISFQHPIQLVQESLPLLQLSGFRNVGAPEIEGVREGDSTVQIITQKVIAPAPGTYHAGQSSLQGFIYSEDAYGNKTYGSQLLEAIVPDTVIMVSDFPSSGKPASFNGSIGVFLWRVKLLGSQSVVAGDKIQLEIVVSGSGDFDTVILPDLSLQKGFKNNFTLSDLAPVGKEEEGVKKFIVELRPVSTSVTQIPAIEFSSFDPISKTYVVKTSEPIPLSVRPSQLEQKPSQENLSQTQTTLPVSPLEIQGNRMLKESELRTVHMQTILIVYTLLFLTGVWIVEIVIKRIIESGKKKEKDSYAIFIEAIKLKNDPNMCCKMLQQALLLSLFETGLTKELCLHPEQLSTDGLQGDIRKFISSIEEKRFTGLETQVEIQDIITEASQLYYQLKKIPKG